jgi:hypothetical protein
MRPQIPAYHVAAVFPIAAATADVREASDDLDAHHVFRHLIVEVALHAKPERRTVGDWQVLAVEAASEDALVLNLNS